MINIFLILLLIHYIGLLILKPKINTLSCGIFGWAGKDPKKFNKDKFDKLGMFNVERGKSSCGISYDGDVYIGIGSRKLYNDFLIDEEIKPIKFPVVIGHTRQASAGTAVTVHNAHPFAFGEYGEYELIGCHNGTLYNKEELASTFDIEEKEEYSEYSINLKESVKKEREKIDSEILLECIYRSKNFKVLSDYYGAAALMFTNLNEPNTVYLFKGESKMHSYSKPEDTSEERPLFVYIENKNSMYVSSLEDSLRTIGGNDDNIIDINTNTLYKITDGDFMKAEKITVSRTNAQQTSRPYKSSKHISSFPREDWEMDYYSETLFDHEKKHKEVMSLLPQNYRKEAEKSQIQKTIDQIKKEREGKTDEVNIYTEPLNRKQDEYGNKIYFNKLRFWRNGHLIKGIYTWVMNFGYYYLGEDLKSAEEKFWLLVDKPFRSNGFVYEEAQDNDFIPFKSVNVINPGLFFFVEGTQIRTALDYAIFRDKYKKIPKGEYLSFVDLSHVTSHPIINLNHEYKEANAQCITHNGKIYSGQVTTLGSEKNYTISLGCLVAVKDSGYYQSFLRIVEEDTKLKVSTEDFVNEAFTAIEEAEITKQDDDELLNSMIENEESQKELVLEIVNEDFAEPMQDFQNTRSKLMAFSENTVAIKVINFIDNTLDSIKKIIEP